MRPAPDVKYTAAMITVGGTPGGELVATRAHYNSSPIDDSVYDNISEHTGVLCRFSAMYLRLQKLTVIIAVVY